MMHNSYLIFFDFTPRIYNMLTVILSILSRYRYLTVSERGHEGCPKWKWILLNMSLIVTQLSRSRWVTIRGQNRKYYCNKTVSKVQVYRWVTRITKNETSSRQVNQELCDQFIVKIHRNIPENPEFGDGYRTWNKKKFSVNPYRPGSAIITTWVNLLLETSNDPSSKSTQVIKQLSKKAKRLCLLTNSSLTYKK